MQFVILRSSRPCQPLQQQSITLIEQSKCNFLTAIAYHLQYELHKLKRMPLYPYNMTKKQRKQSFPHFKITSHILAHSYKMLDNVGHGRVYGIHALFKTAGLFPEQSLPGREIGPLEQCMLQDTLPTQYPAKYNAPDCQCSKTTSYQPKQ